MKTIINRIENDWVNIKNKCRTTINKDYTDNEPKSKFKTDLLISEHSPIRLLKIDWSWRNIFSWVATQFSRSKWECFISTRRSDRIGFDRGTLSQNELVGFDGEANAQNLIDTARKRLCFQASQETRVLMEDLKLTLKDTESELADVLVPNCIYRMGCPEFQECGFIESFINKHEDDTDLLNIRSRYEVYNDDFYSKFVK